MKCLLYNLIFFIGLLIFTCSEPRPPLTLYHGKIHNDFHQQNLGKITFLQEYIPFKDYSEKDFLDEVILEEGKNLFIRVFLPHTQTHYLNELVPNLTPNQLCKKGNWQVKFFVDGQLAYEENINPGGGSCEVRNDQTVIGIPLIEDENMGHWGELLWLKFMKKGKGGLMLEKGSHLLRLEFRPYIKVEKEIVGELVASGEVMVRKRTVEVDEKEIEIQKIQETNDWVISEEKIDRNKIRALNKKIAQQAYKKISSVVVIKKGELVLEEYFNGASRNTLHDTRSVGKSFASSAVGMAINDGYIKNEDVSLEDVYGLKDYQNFDARKASISIAELLTMTAPLLASDQKMDSPGQEEKMYRSNNWVKFCLDLPVDKEKAAKPYFDYNSVSSVLTGDIIHKKVPKGLESYLLEKLFNPLGITQYRFQYTPQQVLNTAGGTQLRTLDLAKYGQLYKNGGEWNGKQIIPQDWVDKSLSRLVETGAEDNSGYGYYFWNKTFTVNGKEYEAAYASGNGGNKVFIFKDVPLVIVITATGFGQFWAHLQAYEMIREYLLPAVMDVE